MVVLPIKNHRRIILMENPQRTKNTSIHLSPETIAKLDTLKHLGQSYDGVIKEVLLKLTTLETTK
jgi:predicted DNA-binding protein